MPGTRQQRAGSFSTHGMRDHHFLGTVPCWHKTLLLVEKEVCCLLKKNKSLTLYETCAVVAPLTPCESVWVGKQSRLTVLRAMRAVRDARPLHSWLITPSYSSARSLQAPKETPTAGTELETPTHYLRRTCLSQPSVLCLLGGKHVFISYLCDLFLEINASNWLTPKLSVKSRFSRDCPEPHKVSPLVF